jgi:N-acetylmuramoyl-L-alanine amidase
MNRLPRAASLAAASLVFVFGAPSLALELTGSTLTPDFSAPAGIGAPPPAASAPPVAAAQAEPATESDEPVRRSLAELVTEHSGTRTSDAQHECLAGAVYFEAKGEPLQGQLSVAEVILNRARSGRFPASACGVVKQRGQFSFVRGGRFPAIARGSLAWKRAVAIARIAVQDLADGPAPKALFFHAKRVSPRWRLTRVAAVGNHIFYR